MDSYISLQEDTGNRKEKECYWRFMTDVAVLLISMCIIVIIWTITDSEGILGMS